jgi:DNA-binding PadR family transcriptional regulator
MNDLLLLSLLLGGSQHGYALKKQAGAIFGQGEMHNNLVYPLLKKFVDSGWVRRRSAAGRRGQTREMYSLTAKGNKELMRRLAQFTEKEAASENEFRLRVGLFFTLDAGTRKRILNERDQWLAAREEKFVVLEDNMELGEWGGEVVRFLRENARAERIWIASLRRKVERDSKNSKES